jgi:branched-chain amino acid aminotransferase
MNVFFIMGNKAITPDLSTGTILAGITRDSAITMLKEAGLTVEERPVSMDEVAEAYDRGELTEVFGTGTAATVSLIKELKFKEKVMYFDTNNSPVSSALKNNMADLKEGKIPDTHGWLYKL